MKRISTVLVGFALALAPGSALAQGSATCQAYNPQLCAEASGTQGTTSAGTLPFTGLDAALLVVGGGGLLGAGLAVRRRVRRVS